MSGIPASPVVASYTVTGMTCGHCAGSVTAELSKVPGVAQVDVDLSTGAVTVTSGTALDDAAVAAAVTEAGYEVAAVRPFAGTPANGKDGEEGQ